MEQVKIRPATKADSSSIINLIRRITSHLKISLGPWYICTAVFQGRSRSITPIIKRLEEIILFLLRQPHLKLLLEFVKDPCQEEDDLQQNLFGDSTYYGKYGIIVAELLSDPGGPESTEQDNLASSKMGPSEKIIGYAHYNYSYNTWEGEFLFIEDLFVKKEMRGKGVGVALMKECAKIAVANECCRMVWQAVDWNTSARRFYEQRIGGTCHKELLIYKLQGERSTRFYKENSEGVMDVVKIRPATVEDVPTIMYLTQLFAEFCREPNAPKLGEKEVLKHLFGEGKYANAVVAELLTDPEEPDSVVPNELPSRNKRIVGYAIYCNRYNTAFGRHLYIEDIFVKEEMRKNGIGSAIFRECAKIAADDECTELKWLVRGSNTDAIRFYEKHIGAMRISWELTFHMEREEFTKFVQERST